MADKFRIVDGAAYEDEFRTLTVEYTMALGRDLGFQHLDEELESPIKKYVGSGGGMTVALDLEGNAIGCVAYWGHSPERCEMKRLYVKPSHRGQGIGEALSKEVLMRAAESGFSEMVLDTVTELGAAVALYKKLGFSETAPYYHNPMPDVIYMIKKLDRKKIKNVVFDFGKVMVHFEPLYMTEQYVRDAEDARLVSEVVFDRLYWDRLDAGTVTDSEVVEACKKRLPTRLHAVAEKVYYNWIYNIPEIEGMSDLVRRVRDEYGARVFLLSNISTYFAEHREEIPSLALFEKCIFSAVCGRVKPSREMFGYLCDECGILPDETLFVDDSKKNIEGAEAYGIKGYLFDGDVGKLEKFLQKVLPR